MLGFRIGIWIGEWWSTEEFRKGFKTGFADGGVEARGDGVEADVCWWMSPALPTRPICSICDAGCSFWDSRDFGSYW